MTRRAMLRAVAWGAAIVALGRRLAALGQTRPRRGRVGPWRVRRATPTDAAFIAIAMNETAAAGRHVLRKPPKMTRQSALEYLMKQPMSVVVEKLGEPVCFVSVPKWYLPGDPARRLGEVEAQPDVPVPIQTVACIFSRFSHAERVRAVQLGGIAALRQVKRMGFRKVSIQGAADNPLLGLIDATLNDRNTGRVAVKELARIRNPSLYRAEVVEAVIDADVADSVSRDTVPDAPDEIDE